MENEISAFIWIVIIAVIMIATISITNPVIESGVERMNDVLDRNSGIVADERTSNLEALANYTERVPCATVYVLALENRDCIKEVKGIANSIQELKAYATKEVFVIITQDESTGMYILEVTI